LVVREIEDERQSHPDMNRILAFDSKPFSGDIDSQSLADYLRGEIIDRGLKRNAGHASIVPCLLAYDHKFACAEHSY
jgi:hypothetical protein